MKEIGFLILIFLNLLLCQDHPWEKNTKSHCNGIDRINNKLHYQLFNIISCCTDCNMMKRNYKYESFIEKCNQMVNGLLG